MRSPDFDSVAASTANGHGLLLGTFRSVASESAGVVDVDFTRHGATAWVVGRDQRGTWWQSRVELNRDSDGRWASGASSTSMWEGWAEMAQDRPAFSWPEHGPVLGLGFESGGGSVANRTFSSVNGIVASEVVAIEFGFPGHCRRRRIESPTGGFIMAVPTRHQESAPVLKAIYADGLIVDLSP